MALIAFCHYHHTALLLRSVLPEADLYINYLCTTAKTFFDTLRSQKPSLVLLTSEYISQPSLFTHIHQQSPSTRIILCVLPDTPTATITRSVLNSLGIHALCLLSELDDCLFAVIHGRFYTSSFIISWSAVSEEEALCGWTELTNSERSIVKLLAEGKSGPQIAQLLFISPKTVDNHKYKISQKLNVTGGPGSLVKFSLLNREKILFLTQEINKR